jgi:hypothetical protein
MYCSVSFCCAIWITELMLQSLVQCVVQLLVQLLKQFCKFHEFVNFVRICSSSSSREMIFSLRCPVIQGDNLVHHEDTCCKGSIVSVGSSGRKHAVGHCMCFSAHCKCSLCRLFCLHARLRVMEVGESRWACAE